MSGTSISETSDPSQKSPSAPLTMARGRATRRLSRCTRAAHALGFAELLINHLLHDKRWGEAASQQELVVELTEVVYGEPAVSSQLRWLEQISSHVPDLDPSLAQQRRLFTVSVLRRSLAAYQRTFPEGHLLVGDAHVRPGMALANAGETSEAAQELAHGLEICADAPTDEVMAARLLLADLRSH